MLVQDQPESAKPNPPPRSIWERHFQTFIGMAILAVGVWVVDTTQDQTVALAVQTEKIRVLTLRIDRLAALAVDRYTANDADRDFEAVNTALDRLRARMDRIEEIKK